MKIDNLNVYHKGWVVGDFEPTLLKTTDCEVGIKRYNKNDVEPAHYHKISTEYTIVVDGIISMNGIEYKKNDMIIIEPNEVVEFKSVEDSITVVIKIPHTPNDKYVI